jgi:hypothetical protein
MRFALLSAFMLSVLGSLALAADDPSILFSDDFSTLDPAWGNADANMQVAGGKMVLKPQVNGSYTALYQGTTFDEVDVRVKITQTEGMADEPAGVVFWAVDYDNKYEAFLQADGNFSVVRGVKGKFLNPVAWKVQDAVKKGLNQVNELRVVTKGHMATVYINDKEVASFKGFPPEGGSEVGLHAESGTAIYTWTFSDFVVRKPQ